MTKSALIPSTRRVAAAFAALALGTGLALSASVPASAHDTITSSTPASGDVVTADPTAVTLTYSDELLTLGGDTSASAIQVTDPAGAFHENGCLAVDGSTVSVGVALGDPGTYTVTWQVVSSDGHPTSGSYTFEYQPTGAQNSLNGTPAPPACGDAWAGSPRESSSPVETPEPIMTTQAEVTTAQETGVATAVPTDSSTPDDGDRTWLVVGVSIAGLALIATVIVLTIRRMRKDPFDKP